MPRRAPEAIADKIRRRHRKNQATGGGDDQERHGAIECAYAAVLFQEGRQIKGDPPNEKHQRAER
jgi:hypothetical protein